MPRMIDPIRAAKLPSRTTQFAVRRALEVPPGENVEILVRNPRTPLDLSLGLMKNLLTRDPKNLSDNQEVSDTIRQLALRMYKQRMEEANEK